ncbi:1134_t:CDS:2, partial [Paraglomus occultum]
LRFTIRDIVKPSPEALFSYEKITIVNITPPFASIIYDSFEHINRTDSHVRIVSSVWGWTDEALRRLFQSFRAIEQTYDVTIYFISQNQDFVVHGQDLEKTNAARPERPPLYIFHQEDPTRQPIQLQNPLMNKSQSLSALALSKKI